MDGRDKNKAIVAKNAYNNLPDFASNFSPLHTAAIQEMSVQNLYCPAHQYACCVAVKGVSNKERMETLRFAAARASTAPGLTSLMSLWLVPYTASAAGEPTDASQATCTSIPHLWKVGSSAIQKKNVFRVTLFFLYYVWNSYTVDTIRNFRKFSVKQNISCFSLDLPAWFSTTVE